MKKRITTLIKIYQSLHGKSILPGGTIHWPPLEKYRDFLTTADKGERLMRYKSGNNGGNVHFWYLKIYHLAQHTAASELNTNAPWTHIHEPRFTNFEEWYEYVKSILSGIDRIKYIVWYDVSLIMAYLMRQDLMPKDRVYIHAVPQTVANLIFPHLGVSGAIIKQMNKDHFIKYNDVPACIKVLTAYEIEDFLCFLGHEIRNCVKSNPKGIDSNILDILDEIIKRHSIIKK